eukprot:3100550-Prymnesium_polylepis.1
MLKHGPCPRRRSPKESSCTLGRRAREPGAVPSGALGVYAVTSSRSHPGPFSTDNLGTYSAPQGA